MSDKLNHFPSASTLMLDLRCSECITSFTFINTIWIPYSALDKCTWLYSPICWSSVIILFRAIVLIMLFCSSSRYPCPMWIISSSLWKPVILLITNCLAPNYSLKTNALVLAESLGIWCFQLNTKLTNIVLLWYCNSGRIIFHLFSPSIIWFHLSEKCLHLWCSRVYLLVPFIAEGRRKGNCITVQFYFHKCS